MLAVLKLDHRPKRDERITTHCILVSRIFGVKRFFYTGERDPDLEERIEKLQERWGTGIQVEWRRSWKELFSEWDPCHLTMYGLPFRQKLKELKSSKRLLIVVGGPKVKPEIYRLARWNLSVSNQPHSEVAALAILLWELRGHRFSRFKGKLRIRPSARGKILTEQDDP
ncbi:MAG: tRNA (cytidine(56)-2'-O)-methyltransferase [Candidatus Aenigmatarchaeota archaeon]|nr:MAG: tRNA (cytidine(56)-2'-O)-methyltransferase [Candidatus Aenigmarchaeota archaeon]